MLIKVVTGGTGTLPAVTGTGTMTGTAPDGKHHVFMTLYYYFV